MYSLQQMSKESANIVNQLLFATNLFCNLSEINWFTATNYLKIIILEIFENWFTARNNHDEEALAHLINIYRTQIKVG